MEEDTCIVRPLPKALLAIAHDLVWKCFHHHILSTSISIHLDFGQGYLKVMIFILIIAISFIPLEIPDYSIYCISIETHLCISIIYFQHNFMAYFELFITIPLHIFHYSSQLHCIKYKLENGELNFSFNHPPPHFPKCCKFFEEKNKKSINFICSIRSFCVIIFFFIILRHNSFDECDFYS